MSDSALYRTRREWRQFGKKNLSESSHSDRQWAIGDWLVNAPGEWGEMYAEAEKITGISKAMLKQLRHVSSKFQKFDRSNKLTWTHHLRAAVLPEKERVKALSRAVAESWNVRQMARYCSLAKGGKRAKSSTPVVDHAQEVFDSFTKLEGEEKKAAARLLNAEINGKSMRQIKNIGREEKADKDCSAKIYETHNLIQGVLSFYGRGGGRRGYLRYVDEAFLRDNISTLRAIATATAQMVEFYEWELDKREHELHNRQSDSTVA